MDFAMAVEMENMRVDRMVGKKVSMTGVTRASRMVECLVGIMAE